MGRLKKEKCHFKWTKISAFQGLAEELKLTKESREW